MIFPPDTHLNSKITDRRSVHSHETSVAIIFLLFIPRGPPKIVHAASLASFRL